VGGFINENESLGWRWVFYLQIIFGGVATLITIALPETYAPVLLQTRARKLRKEDPIGNSHLWAEHERADWSVKGILHRTIFRPFDILFREKIVMLITAYLSLVYGLVYGCFESYGVIFGQLRGMSLGQSGLVFNAIGIGSVFGGVITVYMDRYHELAPQFKNCPAPENRLPAAILAGPFLVSGCLILGWGGAYGYVNWAVPSVGGMMIGLAMSCIYISFLTYLVDTYLMYAASALAINTICRSACGAAFSLFTRQMYIGMGTQWAGTLLALVCLLLAPSPLIFYKYGARIRSSSHYAPGLDLKIAQELELERLEKEGKAQV